MKKIEKGEERARVAIVIFSKPSSKAFFLKKNTIFEEFKRVTKLCCPSANKH